MHRKGYALNADNIVVNYNRIDPDGRGGHGDIDYCLHEMAHFVVLFRRAPRKSKDDIQDMQFVLDDMPCGFAQLHELRTIKLQSIVLRCAAKPILKQVIWGIYDVAAERKRGQKDIVTSVTKAMRLMRDMDVSPRLVNAYRRAIERFSS
jgi:hypothetical protein